MSTPIILTLLHPTPIDASHRRGEVENHRKDCGFLERQVFVP